MRTFAGIQWHAGVRKCGSIGNQKLGVWTQYIGARRRTSAAIAACPLEGRQLLDHRVSEDHIECAVGKLAQTGGIASTRLDVLVDGRLVLEIDKDHMNVLRAASRAAPSA